MSRIDFNPAPYLFFQLALGFVRGDYRFGDKLSGAAIVAGLRYTFGPTK